MPEIKIKHVISFSSEDKVHKAENILKSETYRKWKCAAPGEKKASIILQFEKATQIHSIDIGNESSSFVEVLVGRSSDSVNDFQVLLVASSFMSPLESRNETHTNRVRMFGPDKLTQNIKDEKWDCVQVVCTQPFNKNISYGLCFIKFHSPPESCAELPTEKEAKKAPARLGAFKIKYDDEDDDKSVPSVSSWLERKNKKIDESLKTFKPESTSYADAVLASSDSPPLRSPGNPLKRKVDSNDTFDAPPAKKETSIYHVNKKKIGYKDILDKNVSEAGTSVNTDEDKNVVKDIFGLKKTNTSKVSAQNENGKVNKKKQFGGIMEKVVFVISGFVNPLRSEIRDKALEMGAKYKGDWDGTCTHLVCAFENTPKYVQVKRSNGKIVSKDWIIDCHKKKTLLPWKKYMLGKYSRDTSEESSESDVEETPPQKKDSKGNSKLNGAKTSKDLKNSSNSVPNASSSPKGDFGSGTSNKTRKATFDIKSDSETDDEDAIQDYMADTDVKSESDSGGDTEDEIMKVENPAARRVPAKKEKKEEPMSEDDSPSLLFSKPDTSDMPLPSLLNLFKKRHFYLYGDFSNEMLFDLERYITAYDGMMDEYMSDSTKYVVTDSKWDRSFDDALSEHEDLVFVRSKWIFKCHEAQKLVPYQSYVVIPT